ncbi:MAG TPA: S9 family peptidase [Burkholderiales bacterium]|nr:S9 family peptidase [Burkholderiales bacterium]
MSRPPLPPAARRIPFRSEVHGRNRTDDYHWLRDKGSRAVTACLEAENAYTEAMMKPSRRLQEALYREMLGRIKETDVEVPYRDGDWFYYSRTRKGSQYRIFCRRRGSVKAPERVVLDANVEAKGRKFYSLGMMDVSPDGNILAFSFDTTGFREYTLRFRDLRDGRMLPEAIARARSVAWASDNRTVFYVAEDEAKRACRVYRHLLGSTQDELVYEETDERFSVAVSRSRSNEYLFLTSHSATTSEVRCLRADAPGAPFALVLARRQDHEYYLDHGDGQFYIVTNDRGRNFRLVTAPAGDPSPARWTEFIAHRDDVMLEGVDVFARHLVVHERKDGFPRLRVVRLADRAQHVVEMPEPVYSVGGGPNMEFDTDVYRFHYDSYVTPDSLYDYHLDTRDRKLLKRRVVRRYDASKYRSELHFAVAHDGTRVPISLVYRIDRRRKGPQPLLLYGYGSYGYSLDVDFSSVRLSLLDRGVIFAVAHVRGGGEMGKRWHDDGRMLAKKNTFTDFIACAEHLVREHYTEPAQLAIQGGSAGGLLMGAVANMRPELFRAVVAEVPFVDVVNTMLDASLPLTTGEYEEWGNPNDGQYYDYMLSYSPYDNLARKDYPAMLVETSLNDSQVMYWEPAKYVAKLRSLKTDMNPLLLRVNMDAGHGGASGRYDFLREIAFTYAFILGVLGILR